MLRPLLRAALSAAAPVAAVGLAVVLVHDAVPGYSLLGGGLGLTQRDVRLYNTFSDAQTNDNTTQHPQFPGFDGAELAIWKSAVEWGSTLHGDGTGDPSQQGGLGSGGANFDPSWQGNATAVGSTNENVHSPLAGGSGGVLAYCETPISDGWRIRYYESWTWDDGPGTSVSGFDLQSVATHEFGHAIGLGHSGVGGSTMWPSIGGGSTSERSIGPDDILGVQAIYGVAAPSKPRITSVTVSGTGVTILGQNFHPTTNEVWFTRNGPGDGTPVKATGVPSSLAGTRIDLGAWPSFVPGAAGPGDLLVRTDGGAYESLSNAFPASIQPGPSCSGGVPTVQSVFPAQVPALAAAPRQVTLLGCDFEGTTGVTVDGAPLSFLPPAFEIVSDTQLVLTLPPATKLGAVDIVVTNAVGTGAAATLQVVAPAPPLVTVPDLAFGAIGLPLAWGGQPGDFFFLVASPDPTPTVIPGLFSADLGGGFTTLFLVGQKGVPTKGWGEVALTYSGLPTGTVLYFQGLVLEAADPVLPLVSTAVDSSTVLF